MHDILALPAWFGGIGVTKPTSAADMEFSAATRISEPLKQAILLQHFTYSGEVITELLNAKYYN